MANEIISVQVDGLTLYAVLINSTGQFWRTDSTVFEAFNASNWTHYAISMSENSTTGIFYGTMPAAPSGSYKIAVYLKAGGSASVTDLSVDSLGLNWSGSTVLSLSNVRMDLTQPVPTSNTAQTVGDALNAARAQGFGKWVLSGTTITLYAADGTTVVRTFTLDNAVSPMSRS